MSSQSELFSSIYDFLDKGYDRVNARGGNYQQPFTLLHQEIGKLWNRSGHELNYSKYSPSPAPNYRNDRKTIQQELSHMAPYYNMYQPCSIADPPKPSPLIPQFRNEFADLRPRPEPQLNMPPPPAKTTGLKPHCKFCKNNGEHPDMYLSHQLSSCPILTTFNCTNCNQKGHTQ